MSKSKTSKFILPKAAHSKQPRFGCIRSNFPALRNWRLQIHERGPCRVWLNYQSNIEIKIRNSVKNYFIQHCFEKFNMDSQQILQTWEFLNNLGTVSFLFNQRTK